MSGRIRILFVLGVALLAGGFSTAWAQDAGVPAKQPGVLRIGIVKPKVQMGADDSSQSADAVRNIFADYLQGPTIEVALLSARLPSQYTVEAQQAQCDYVLASSLAYKRGNQASGFGAAIGKLATQAPYIPGADYAQSAIVTGVLTTAADFAATVKAKDEMTLTYQLHAIDTPKAILDKNAKRRAKTDGEDLLTPLVESVAEAVGEAVAR